MNFKQWLISEEIHYKNNTATVYHRTCPKCDEDESVKSVSSILTSYFKPNKGCMYGCGLYTTYKIESQFNQNMKGYGKAVVKFKVENLDKYLIFELDEAKNIHGNDYKISDQLKKLGILDKVNKDNLKEYDELQIKGYFSSTLAKKFYDQNDWIENSVKGIIYYGESDGYCLLKYPKVEDGTITMLGYSVARFSDMKKMEKLKNNIGWIKSVGVLGTPIKRAYNAPDKMKEKFALGDNNYLSKIDFNLLSDDDVYGMIVDSGYKNKEDETAELIIKNKSKLSQNNIFNLLFYCRDKDKIAKLLQEKEDNINKLYNFDFSRLSDVPGMAKVFMKYKKNLSAADVAHLLEKEKPKEEIKPLFPEP